MYKLKKGGVVRIVATESEKKRWESLGYEVMAESAAAEEPSDTASPDPLEEMDVDALKAYALANGISIGNATSQSGILKKIREARPLAPSED